MNLTDTLLEGQWRDESDIQTPSPEAIMEEQLLDYFHGEGDKVASFKEAGIMTRNHGVVVRTDDAEFQITIVQSR